MISKQDLKVSIIIPVYNGSNYLREAINSALNQTYSNIEILVINDGSNDGGDTERIALSYGDKIRYFSKENGGVSSALNVGIKNMTGVYFSWLSHDDLYSKNKIEDSINLLIKMNLIGTKTIAYTGNYFINRNGSVIKKAKNIFESNYLYNGVEVAKKMTEKGTLNGCCFLIPKDAFYTVGMFDENLRYSQDSLMWYNIFLSGYSLITDNKINVMSRIHSKQVSQTRRDLFEHDSMCIAKFLAKPLMSADPTDNLFLKYCKRITKYKLYNVIKYMISEAKSNNFSYLKILYIYIHIFLGTIRFYVAKIYKFFLIK